MKTLTNVRKFCALAATAMTTLAAAPQVFAQSSENTHFIAVTKGKRMPDNSLKFQDMAACKAYAEKYFSQYQNPMLCSDHDANISEFGIAIRVDDRWQVTWAKQIK